MIANDTSGGYPVPPAPALAEPKRTPWSSILAFVGVWLLLFIGLGAAQVMLVGLWAWGAGDNGSSSSPLYQPVFYGSFLLFGVTQMAALFGGLTLILQRQGLLRLGLLLAGLYGFWICGILGAMSLV
jgi:hypothetical protein